MIPFVATSSTRRRRFVFASLVVLQWLIAFTATFFVRHVGTGDPAYYYVVARNVAQGRGLTDNVLWHFLHVPATVEQPAGTYWEIGWPLLLGWLMRPFGDSQRVAILVCALLSGLLPLLTARIAYQLSKRLDVAWFAGLLLCLQAPNWTLSVIPDSILPYQISCLLAISAFLSVHEQSVSRAKLPAVGVAFALPIYVRGEGFLVPLGLCFLLIVASTRSFREKVRRLFPVLAGMSVVVIPFAIRNVFVMGRLFPPPRSLRLWMRQYDDLSAFRTDPSPTVWWSEGIEQLGRVRYESFKSHLNMLLFQLSWPLLGFAVLGCTILIVNSRKHRPPVVPLFLLLTLLVPCLVVPLIASPLRFVSNVLPCFCVCAAVSIFAIVDRMKVLCGKQVGWGFILMAAAAITTLFRPPASIGAYVRGLVGFRHGSTYLNPDALEALKLQRDDVVLTDEPWRVSAELDVATVSVPLDGDAAIEAMMKMYQPRFVLVGSGSVLRQFVTKSRVRMRPVATFRTATWYEVDGPVKSATGKPTLMSAK